MPLAILLLGNVFVGRMPARCRAFSAGAFARVHLWPCAYGPLHTCAAILGASSYPGEKASCVRLWNDMIALFKARCCAAVAKHVSAVAAEIAKAMGSSVDDWAEFDWKRSAAALEHGASKRRRMDPT